MKTKSTASFLAAALLAFSVSGCASENPEPEIETMTDETATALQEEVDRFNSANQDDYTDYDWDTYANTAAVAQKRLSSPTASEDAASDALDAIRRAADNTMTDEEREQKEEEEAEAAEAAAAAAEKEAMQKKVADSTRGDGVYKVGTDLDAGEYFFTSSSMGYICIYHDSTKSEILENDNWSNQYYVTVEDGQYLEVTRAEFVPMSLREAYLGNPSKSKSLSEGMYKVGLDCDPGEYKLDSDGEMGYYCIYNNSSADRHIIDNDNFEGQNYVTVSEGQYLILNRCTAKFVE